MIAKIKRHGCHTASIATSLIIHGEMSLIIANEAANSGLIDSSSIPLITLTTITSILVTLPIINKVIRIIGREQTPILEISE